MTNVYRVVFEQRDASGSNLWVTRETVFVRARTAEEGMTRAARVAKGVGFAKTPPIEVVSVTRLVRDLK